MSSSNIRIKVQVGDDKKLNSYHKIIISRKFVYVINNSLIKTIDELIHHLQEYIIQKFSLRKFYIVDLITDDGYLLSKSDLCSNVLKDNDQIICIDMQKFIEEYNTKFKDDTLWLELKQHDASDNQDKFIRIVLNNLSELVIRMHGTTGLASLYVFGIYELLTIANEKRKDNLIGRLDSTNEYEQTSSIDWFIETKWEYDTVSNKDLFIICTLKIGSSDQVVSNKLQIVLDPSRMRVQKGEITLLSSGNNDTTISIEQRLKELAAKIPPPKRIGPQIKVNTNENLKITKHECEGESSIRMAYGNTNAVTTYQHSDISDDGTFCQSFVITHIIFSKKPHVLPEILQQKRSAPVDKPASVTSLTVLYQAHDESWHECQDIAIAPLVMRNEEPNWLTDFVINIEPDKLISFSIKCWTPVKGEPGIDEVVRERVHKNLPQPLKLKIVITDNLNKQCSLIVEQLNKPLVLPNRDLFSKRNQSTIIEFLTFVYADDCENDERICLAMYISLDNRLVIKKYDTAYVTFDRKLLRTMEYNAKQTKTIELPLKTVHYQRYTKEINAFALFDPETYMFYAIRLEISTKTSKTEETVLIPIDKIK